MKCFSVENQITLKVTDGINYSELSIVTSKNSRSCHKKPAIIIIRSPLQHQARPKLPSHIFSKHPIILITPWIVPPRAFMETYREQRPSDEYPWLWTEKTLTVTCDRTWCSLIGACYVKNRYCTLTSRWKNP